MEITIVGTGNMTRGIGSRALAGGHTITVHGTERQKAEALADELGGDTKAGTVGEPIAGDIVVPAVPYAALGDVVARYAEQLNGTIVVDITNPVDFQTWEPILPEAGAAAPANSRHSNTCT